MLNVSLFIKKFLNNQLNDRTIKDQKIYDEEVKQIIIKLPNKLNELIITTSHYLPEISMSIMNLCFYDQELIYQALKNIYIKYLYKCPNKSITSFALIIGELTCSICNDNNDLYKIEDYRQQYIKKQKLKLPIINNFNFCIFDFSLKRWRKIFIYLVYLFIKNHDKNKRYFLYVEILVFMYKRYVQILHKEYKYFINPLVKLIIYIFMNNCLLKIGREPNGKQNNIYIYIMDVIISEWDLIYPRYQLIIKQNIKQWIKMLQQQGYNNLHDKDALLNIILKLK